MGCSADERRGPNIYFKSLIGKVMSDPRQTCLGASRPSVRSARTEAVPFILCTILVLTCLGCQPAASFQTPLNQRVAAVHTAAGETLITHATFAQWPADFQRVPDDLFRSFRDLGWGRMRIATSGSADAANRGPEPHNDDTANQHVVYLPNATPCATARGLTPDGKQLEFIAWPVPDTTPAQIAVAIRIGHFGDEKQERQFLAMLTHHLAGKPRPKRDATFTLPDATPHDVDATQPQP